MSKKGLKSFQAFKMNVEKFLGNHRRGDYELVISNIISAYEKFVCRASVKLHFYTVIWIFGFFGENSKMWGGAE